MHYCKTHPHLKQFFPPRGPGMLQSTADTFCALHELTNRCDRWAPEFKPLQTNYQNFKLAYKMLAEDGQDIHHVLQNIMFGDPPSWLWQPSDKLIFCQQQTPDSPEALDALAKALQEDGIDIARRTVAKYREAMRIPSSVERRRQKRAAN